jgi:hypothetical protein
VYVIQGSGVRSTAHFMLSDERSRVTLNVNPGSSARFWGGIAVIAFGFLVVEVGYAGLLVSAEANNPRTARIAGGLLLGGGGVMALGAYFAATSPTTVRSSSGVSFSKGPAPARRRRAVALTPRGLEF